MLFGGGWGLPSQPYPRSPTKAISTAKDSKIAPNKRCSCAQARSWTVTPIYLNQTPSDA